MDDAELKELRVRLARLENDVASLTRFLGLSGPAAAAQTRPQAPVAQAPLAPMPPRPPLVAPRLPVGQRPIIPAPVNPAAEADFVGTWSARIGIVALLIGAGFGYRFAVERGYIGEAFRVFLGLVIGGGLIAFSDHARRKGWGAFSQAIAAGGVAMMMLSIWAASQRYDLLDPTIAFVILVAITGVAVWLALLHDSLPLAALAALGGFLNPLLVGADAASPAAVFGYILLLDAGILVIATVKAWPALGYQAFVGTWFLYGLKVDEGATDTAFLFATLVFALFALAPMVRAMFTAKATVIEELPIQGLNALAFLAAGLDLLGPTREGGFAAVIGVMMLAFAGVARTTIPHDRLLPSAYSLIALGAIVLAVPLQFDGTTVPILWTSLALILLIGGHLLDSVPTVFSGLAVLSLSVLAALTETFEGGNLYDPDALLVSVESAAIVMQIAAAGVAAWIARRRRGMNEYAPWLAGSANALAILWLTWEASAHFQRTVGFNEQAEQFSWSAIWTLYAAGMLVVGVAASIRWARLMAVVIFGLVLAKAVTVDLWLLGSGQRVIAFIGLGVILLACSLMYQRFRELIIGKTDEQIHPPTAVS